MANVITYGTFDFSHDGHLKLLQRARALGGENDMLTNIVSSAWFKQEERVNGAIVRQ